MVQEDTGRRGRRLAVGAAAVVAVLALLLVLGVPQRAWERLTYACAPGVEEVDPAELETPGFVAWEEAEFLRRSSDGEPLDHGQQREGHENLAAELGARPVSILENYLEDEAFLAAMLDEETIGLYFDRGLRGGEGGEATILAFDIGGAVLWGAQSGWSMWGEFRGESLDAGFHHAAFDADTGRTALVVFDRRTGERLGCVDGAVQGVPTLAVPVGERDVLLAGFAGARDEPRQELARVDALAGERIRIEDGPRDHHWDGGGDGGATALLGVGADGRAGEELIIRSRYDEGGNLAGSLRDVHGREDVQLDSLRAHSLADGAHRWSHPEEAWSEAMPLAVTVLEEDGAQGVLVARVDLADDAPKPGEEGDREVVWTVELLDPAGDVLWSAPGFEPGRRGINWLHIDGLLLWDEGGEIRALDTATGEEAWERPADLARLEGRTGDSPHLGEGGLVGDTVYVPSARGGYLLDPATGEAESFEGPRGSVLLGVTDTHIVLGDGAAGAEAVIVYER